MEWKKVDEYENYSVSSDGTVRNDKTGRILKKCRNKNGYEEVNLYKNGKGKTFKVHRLIAEAFIPNHENKPCIDHINTIRDDNRVENLRWCTYKENSNNVLSIKNNSELRKGERNHMYGKQHSEEAKQKISDAKKGKNNPRCRKVILLNTGEVFDYIKEAEEKYKVCNQNILACCKGRYKSAGKLNGEKLVWMYLDEYLKGENKNE